MNKTFIIQLAGQYFQVEPIYDYVEEYCRDYVISEYRKSDELNSGEENVIKIKIFQSDIVYEREKSASEDIKEGIPIRQFSDAYLETLAVYRKIAELMPLSNILLFHGSVVAVDGKAYLFTAKSGTGKSTHTELWRKYFGEKAIMINDDKPLLKVTEEGVFACGTPWDGKHRLSTNITVPLMAICILSREKKNTIRKITSSEAFPMLMQQCYRPMNTLALTKTLNVLDRLKENVCFYQLGCNISQEAVEVAYKGMQNTMKQRRTH